MMIASKRTENTNRRAAVGAERETNKGSARRLAFFVVSLIKSLGEIILTRLSSTYSSECHGTNGSNKLFTDLKTRRCGCSPFRRDYSTYHSFRKCSYFFCIAKLSVHLIPDETASHAAGSLAAGAVTPVDHAPLRDVPEDLLDALVVPPTLCPDGCNGSRGFIYSQA